MPSGMEDDKYIKKPNTLIEYTPQQVEELLKCEDPINGPLYFMETFMWIQHPVKGSMRFEPFEYQKGLIQSYVTHRNQISLLGRQLGKTTCAVGYLLWYAMFMPDSYILIASKTGDDALDIMDRLRFAYEMLPDHIRAGVRVYNKKSIRFDNGSKIQSTTTTSSTGRGKSLSLIYLDEFAFVDPPRVAKELWTSLSPTLSTGGRIIITSTPNSDQDQFAELWLESQMKFDKNGEKFPNGVGRNGFGSFFATYKDHPERDEKWAHEERSKIGDERFRREHECEFIIFDETLISSMKIAKMKPKDPIKRSGQVRWFKKIRSEATYAVALDPSMGTGGNNAAITIWELPSIEQVGEWRDNRTTVEGQMRVFKDILHEIQSQGDPEIFWTLENNSLGEAALVIIRDTGIENFPGTFVHDRKKDGSDRSRKGFVTTNKSKLEACAKFKQWVESGKMSINSAALIDELKTFVARSNTYIAKQGCYDDLISSTLLFVRMAEVVARWDDEIFESIKGNIMEQEIDENDFDVRMPLPFI